MVSFRDSMYTAVTGVRSILRNGGGVAPELFLDPLRAIGCFAQACAIETRIPKVKLSVGLFAQKMLHGRSGEVCWREDKWCRLKQISKRGASSKVFLSRSIAKLQIDSENFPRT